MDEPLNPFSRGKNTAGPGSRRTCSSLPLSLLIPSANSDTLCSLISCPLTVIGFLIKGVLMGGYPWVQPDFKLQIWCSDAFFVFVSSLYGRLLASLFHFLPFLFSLKHRSPPPSQSFLPKSLYIYFFSLYSPTINTLTVIYFLLLKTEIVFAVILPRSNLLFLSQGKSYYDSAVSPRVDLVQQWDCDFFFDSLVMEAAMKSLAYAANTEVVTVRGERARARRPVRKRDTVCLTFRGRI